MDATLWGLVKFGAGVAVGLLAWLANRYLRTLEDDAAGGEDGRRRLWQRVDDVEKESIARDQQLGERIGTLQQYVDGEFVRQRDLDRVFERMKNLEDKIDRLLQLLTKDNG